MMRAALVWKFWTTWFRRWMGAFESEEGCSCRAVTKSSDEPEVWVDKEFRSLGLFDRTGLVCSDVAGEALIGGGLACGCMAAFNLGRSSLVRSVLRRSGKDVEW